MASTYSRIWYAGPVVSVGSFDCPPTAPDFGNTGPIPGYLLAFPRTPVRIRHLGERDAIIADPNTVTLYNDGQEYERGGLSDDGDHCDWLTFRPETLSEALADAGVLPAGDPQRLFSVSHGTSPAAAYAQVQRLAHCLREHPPCDEVAIEELALTILRSVIRAAYGRTSASMEQREHTASRHRRIVQRTREILATRYAQPLSLTALGGMVHSSPFHLARVFRRLTGTTINQYLLALRVRNALNALAREHCDLMQLGIDSGFCDHSHFTRHFRRTFAITPSAFRQSLSTLTPRHPI